MRPRPDCRWTAHGATRLISRLESRWCALAVFVHVVSKPLLVARMPPHPLVVHTTAPVTTRDCALRSPFFQALAVMRAVKGWRLQVLMTHHWFAPSANSHLCRCRGCLPVAAANLQLGACHPCQACLMTLASGVVGVRAAAGAAAVARRDDWRTSGIRYCGLAK